MRSYRHPIKYLKPIIHHNNSFLKRNNYIIQRAWENRGKEDFFELVDRNSLQEQRIKYNVSLQINLAFEYIAWLCFRTQRPITRKDVKETAEMISNEFDCGVSGWAARVLGAENPILINLPFHLFGKTWRVAFWLNAINQLEKAKSKENATNSLRDIKENFIKTFDEEFKKIKVIKSLQEELKRRNVTNSLQKAKENVIKSLKEEFRFKKINVFVNLREELNKINNTKLAWNHLQIVSI